MQLLYIYIQRERERERERERWCDGVKWDYFQFFWLDCVEENIIGWKVINKERENASINQVIKWKTIAFNSVFLTVGSLRNLQCTKRVSL